VENRFYQEHKKAGLKIIFEEFCRIDQESQESIITPEDFKRLCIKYNIYSLESQNAFLDEMGRRGMATSSFELLQTWKQTIKPRLDQL